MGIVVRGSGVAWFVMVRHGSIRRDEGFKVRFVKARLGAVKCG
jgi:hypothetical protein